MRSPKRSVRIAVIAVAMLAEFTGPAVLAAPAGAAAADMARTSAIAGSAAAPVQNAAKAAVASSALGGAALVTAGTAGTAVLRRRSGERFVLSTRTVGARRLPVLASGALNAHGYAVPGGLTAGRHVTLLLFRRGSVRLLTLVDHGWALAPNLRTCWFKEVYRGGYRLHGGTRRYARATGSGRFVTTIIGRLARRPGGCRALLASVWISTVTSGSIRW
jgi:hypothetical protein